MKTQDIYDDVTKTIVSLLEEHQQTWNKPWIMLGVDNDFARNPTTGKYYRGINQFLLSFSMMKTRFLKNMWMTYQQCRTQGGFVRKNEKSTSVVFYKTAWIDKNKKYYKPETVRAMGATQMAEKGIQDIPVLRLYRVFNVAQTEGLADEFYSVEPSEPLEDFDKDERAERLIARTSARIITEASNEAFYVPATDTIHLPLREQFRGQAQPYYSVCLHELGHWTGHKSRLDRPYGKFGEEAYAKEELVAELSSAFCCATLGFSKPITNNAAYIKNWLGILKADSKAVFKAAAQAQKAADYIIHGPEYSAYQRLGQD